MIRPRRHSFSKRDPFITVYTRAEKYEHAIREMKVYTSVLVPCGQSLLYHTKVKKMV